MRALTCVKRTAADPAEPQNEPWFAASSWRAKRFPCGSVMKPEMAALETVDRDGPANVRVDWRRKPIALRMVH